jgi:Domain of unknown function (DUF4397)
MTGDFMTQPLRALRFLSLALASAALVAACGGSDDDNIDDRTGTADPKVRFVHAVPGGPAVTLQRNGAAESSVTSVDYKYANQYYDVSTEAYTFSLRTATGNIEVATSSLSTERGHKYTLLALPTDSGAELLTIDDPYNKSVASNNARLRVVNASLNAQPFDVYVTAPGADLATLTPQMSNVGYKQAVPGTRANAVDVEGGSYVLRLTPTGSKAAFFTAAVAVPQNGDWLLVTLPEDATPTTANAVRVLRVRADDSDDATEEIVTQ